MMMKILPLMIISMSISLPIASSPLPLGVYVMMLSSLITVSISTLTSSWLAMTIFLIYIGGLLVLFSYFLAIQPNQIIIMNSMLMMTLATLLIMTMMTNKFFYPPIMTYNMNSASLPFMMFNTNYSLILIIAMILLLILVVVVKITYSKAAPLRPFSM